MVLSLSRHFSFEEQAQRVLRDEPSHQASSPGDLATSLGTVDQRRLELKAYLALHVDQPVVVLPPDFATMVEDQMQLAQRARAADRGWLSASNIIAGDLNPNQSAIPLASSATAQVEGGRLAAAMVQARSKLQREAVLEAALQEGSDFAFDAETLSSWQSARQADGGLMLDLSSQPIAQGSAVGFDACNPFEHAAAELDAIDAKLASVQGSMPSSKDDAGTGGTASVVCEMHADRSEGSKDEELVAIRDRYHRALQGERMRVRQLQEVDAALRGLKTGRNALIAQLSDRGS